VQAEENVKKLDNLKGTPVLKELTSLHKDGIEFVEPTDLSGAIRGRHNIYTHMELMIKNAEKSVTFMTSSKGLLRKFDALKPEMERLKKKGVMIKIAAPITKETLPIIKDLMKVAEIRDSKSINARFCIVDDKDLVFMVLDDSSVHPTYDVGVWINTPFFASALNNLFEVAWKDMKPADKITPKA
jgi:sugar-specific transcriptional regulator TrmB